MRPLQEVLLLLQGLPAGRLALAQAPPPRPRRAARAAIPGPQAGRLSGRQRLASARPGYASPFDAEHEFSSGAIKRDFLGFPASTKAPMPDDDGWASFWGGDGAGSEIVRINQRLKNVMPRMLRFYFRDNFFNGGSVPTASIIKSVRPHGPEKLHWMGPVVVVALTVEGGERRTVEDLMFEGLTGGGRLESDDFTLADFRTVIDYSLGYRGHEQE